MVSPSLVLAPGGGRRIWTMVKLYAAVRDLPEIVPLFALVGGTLVVAGYTVYRQQFTLAGDNYVSPAIRHDIERQVRYSEHHQDIEPSWMWKVAQWRKNLPDGTIDVAIWPFKNQVWKYDHVSPAGAKGSPPHERPPQQRGSPYPTEM